MNFKVIISIGDPWNYVTPDGQNVIKGRIINTNNKDYVIVKMKYELDVDENKGMFLLAKLRYKNTSFSRISLLKGVNANFELMNNDEYRAFIENCYKHKLTALIGSIKVQLL